MTSRERLLCAMTGGRPDRVPVAPFTMGVIDPESRIGCELIAGCDMLIDAGCGGDPFLGRWDHIRRDTHGETVTVTIDTPKGPLTRSVWYGCYGMMTVEFPFKTFDDVDRYLSIPWDSPVVDPLPIATWRDRLGDEGVVLAGLPNAVCLAADWFSPEQFCLAWADAPDQVERLVATANERVMAHVEALCDLDEVDGFRIIGGEYVTTQLGPAAAERLLRPFDTELVKLIHRRGRLAYYHNHGPIMRYLPLLADLGIDALDPLEAAPGGDADLKEARQLVGERLCFVGNLDDMQVIETLPEAEVLAVAQERLDAGGDRAFVLGGTASGIYGERGAHIFLSMAQMVR